MRKRGGTRRTTVFTVLAAVSVAAMLVAADAALAGPDPLSGSSSVTLQLRSSGGLKLKPKTLALPVNTKQLAVTDAPVTMSPLAAATLNSTFPNGSPSPSLAFAAGDLIGHVSLNVTTH